MNTLTQEQLNGIWNYYLSLEKDMSNTSRYVEPSGQENVYSFEFAKILILTCTEVESVFKILCSKIQPKTKANDISAYRKIILKKYPNIIKAETNIDRLNKIIIPFSNWNSRKLSWWRAYQNVKHDRGNFFLKATYLNAVTALSALYILIFYLSKETNIKFDNYKSEYISSEYADPYLLCSPEKTVP